MTIPTLFSTYSVHDYHSYGIHGTGQANGLHFHLAATINAQTGTVLLLIFFFSYCTCRFYICYCIGFKRYPTSSEFGRIS